MISFVKGQKLPSCLLNMIEKNGATDYAQAITDSPMTIVLALNGVKDEEFEEIIYGELEIGIVNVVGVPFFTFCFGNIDFDAILYSANISSEEENAVNYPTASTS